MTRNSRRGHRFCRYADDCNIYVRSRKRRGTGDGLGEPVPDRKLRLKVNEAKSAVARPESASSWGSASPTTGARGASRQRPSTNSRRESGILTRRTRGCQPAADGRRATPYLEDGVDTSASARPRECSRTWKRGFADDYACIFGGSGRTGQIASRNCAAEACQSSTQRSPPVRRRDSGVCQDTRRSNRPCATTSSTPRSSPTLCHRPSLTQSNRRGTDPYARWCGRGAAVRPPPIPILGLSQPVGRRLRRTE